jgi:hypothetical protein
MELKKKIGGQERTFKFGMNTSIMLSKQPGFAEATQNGLELMVWLFWAGLLMRKEQNELPEDFSRETVGDWIDEMGLNETAEVYAQAKESLGFIGELLKIEHEKQQRKSAKK